MRRHDMIWCGVTLCHLIGMVCGIISSHLVTSRLVSSRSVECSVVWSHILSSCLVSSQYRPMSSAGHGAVSCDTLSSPLRVIGVVSCNTMSSPLRVIGVVCALMRCCLPDVVRALMRCRLVVVASR